MYFDLTDQEVEEVASIVLDFYQSRPLRQEARRSAGDLPREPAHSDARVLGGP